MKPPYKYDCLACLCGDYFKWTMISQPVLVIQCPHKNKALNEIKIEISAFWTNIQFIFVLIQARAIYNAYGEYLTCTNELECFNIFIHLVVLPSYLIVVCVLITKKLRLLKMQYFEAMFKKTQELHMPLMFDRNEFRKIHTVINVLESIFLCSLTVYAGFQAFKSSDYAIWFIEFLLTFTSSNTFMYYIYLFYVMCRFNCNMNVYMIKLLNARLMDDSFCLSDELSRFLALKIMHLRLLEATLRSRGILILLVTVCVVVCGVTFFYGVITYPQVIFQEDFLFRVVQLLLAYCMHTAICITAANLSNTVSNLIQCPNAS